MKKLLTIFMLLFTLTAFTQVVDIALKDRYMVLEFSTSTTIRKADRDTKVTSKNGIKVADTIFYVNASSPVDTVLTFTQPPGKVGIIAFERSGTYSADIVIPDGMGYTSWGVGAYPDVSVIEPTYYVSNSGNDINDGTSPSTAWKTLSKVSSTALSPGDIVVLKSGDEWDETLTVNQSGTIGNPITYTAYGVGEKPKIYGSEVITGWSLHSGNIWKTTVSDEVTQVFINDERIQNARFPKEGYVYIDVVNSTTSITCNALDAGIDYTGARMHTRTVQWRLISNTVVSSSATTLTVNAAPNYGYALDKAFFLNNHLDFLTAPGEWYFDSGTNTLYVWAPNSDSPANYTVRGSIHENNVLMPNRSYITLKDLELNHASVSSIKAENEVGQSSNYISINNVDIFNPNLHGIHITRITYSEILNSKIHGSMGMGIFLSNPNENDIGHLLVQDNEIIDVAKFEDINPLGISSGLNEAVGLMAKVNDAIIQYNRFENIGYIGIYPRGKRSLVKYNIVKDFCQTLNDGGGIYVWRGNDGTTPHQDNNSGTIIEYNIVDNSNKIGDDGYSRTPTNSSGVSLFYADETTTDVIFRHNIAMNGGSGRAFNANQPKSVTFENNVAFNNAHGFRNNYNSTFAEGSYFTNNLICNIAESSDWFNTGTLTAGMIHSRANVQFTFDNNIYIDRHRTNVFRRLDTFAFIDFTAWKTFIDGDAASEFIGTSLAANETENIIYNDSKVAKTFYLNNATNVANNVTGASITTSFVLQPFTAIILRGLDLHYISTTQYETTPPVVETFTIEETSDGLVNILSFTVSGSPTKYIITESSSIPSRSLAWSDTIPTVYITSTEGAVTLYAWCMDAHGNISTSLSDNTTVGTLSTIGNTTVFETVTSIANTIRANSFTMPEDGYLVSMLVYHNTSTAAVTLGVYSDNSASPNALLGSTASTEIDDSEGWQEIPLTEPIFVASGTTIWLAYNKSGANGTFRVNTTAGLPRAYKTQSYITEALTNPFGTPTLDTGGSYSIYAKYAK